jgi:uncharacterized protein (DUF1330 family)
MNNTNILKANITKNSYVYIESIDGKIDIEKRVYAINWFSTKSLWLYNLYNTLANPMVEKSGGRGFLKARVKKTLYGSKSDYRDVLLIVTYPSLKSFSRLVEMPLFLLVSLLRMFSVKEFTFGFTHRTDDESVKEVPKNQDEYLVHHYKCKEKIDKDIELLCKETNIDIYYMGVISALLSSGDEKAKEQTPCLMDGVIVFKSTTIKSLEYFVQSEKYQALINKMQSSFIATLDRIL